MHHPATPGSDIRQQATTDPHRPQYHFTPPANWLNDPNGLIYWRGQYHLFYQHNPHAPVHGSIHWGHAVSDDLVRWRDLPIALAPTPGGTDAGGCWSGCAVDDGGTPTLVYTGVPPQAVHLATSADGLLTWRKYAGNPVIAGPPADVAAGGDFRDPFLWRVSDGWRMVIGTRDGDIGGVVLQYRSSDLRHWEHLGPILRGDGRQSEPVSTGAMWECPNLLDFGDRQALIISTQDPAWRLMYPFYVTGVLGPDGFAVERQGILVHPGTGGDFYAPQAMRRADGSYLLWGWLNEGRNEAARREAGWAGALSLPLIVSLAADGRLALAPVAELQALRDEGRHYGDITLGAEAWSPEIAGDCLEIAAQIEVGEDAETEIRVRCTPDDTEYTSILVRQADRQIAIVRDHASLDDRCDHGPASAPLKAAGEPVALRIFLDRSTVEVFAEGGCTNLATRVYPMRPDSTGLRLMSRGGPVRVRSLDVWRIKGIW